MGICYSNPVIEAYPLNNAPRSDALEMMKVEPKEMVRVFGLSGAWYIKNPSKRGCSERCCACAPIDTFKIGSSIDSTSDMFHATEDSYTCLNKLMCCGNRPWTTHVYYGPSVGVDQYDHKEVLQIERYARLPPMPCKCCCQQYVTITDIQNQLPLGKVKETCWLCVPNYSVMDAKGEEMFEVHQPTCCCGCIVNCCSSKATCCGLRVPFNMFYPGTEVAVGDVDKIWKNVFAEFLTDEDTYRFSGPDVRAIIDPGRLNLGDLDDKAKKLGQIAARNAKDAIGLQRSEHHYDLKRIPARAWEQGASLLGATLLLNQLYFE
ncbi:hypothetical protein T492DRAFT_1020113 [Pavlovales sp. CCMP2436]|nr:hypothetical protein T492DRAFT_1020113 [Pavlovales sp. CCMP2436]